MAVAGWYDDPTRVGRRRYWDGGAWTSYVSDGGPTANDPLPDPPPAPPGAGAGVVPPAAAGAGAAARGQQYPWTVLGRAGFGLAAVGGVLTAATAGSTAVDQEPFGYIEVAGGSWIGVIAAVLGVAFAAAPWPWARLTGVGVTTLFALLVSFALIGFRTSDDLVPGVDVSLGAAGWLMLISALLLFAGTAVALVGLRRPAGGPDPTLDPKDGKAVASLVLGIIGLFIPVTAAPAVGLGLFAMDDVRVTGGRIGGRGLAVAGFVLGIVSLSLWALGLLLGMLLAQP
ncbi:MAG TPA: DUF4190 domain-containing protein [Miltoncostaea sp.]|nr:DUF4190 domain-containing protein [Miltoncostaea sp.]